MPYDLYPRKKDVERISYGVFFWPYILLEIGVGLVIGAGNSIRPASYRYNPDKRGASPMSMDGYYVTKKNACLMAAVARGWASVERGKREEWESLSEEERTRMEEWNKDFVKTYSLPAALETIEKVEGFADFAEKSGGFRIK
ncbi:hypothetical protein [Paenibacillus sp. FSL L8-0323]|uniref:hypothetical protein n=1 Tax=unclassified Paenibacillus TaxID=185978 RepID=UPI0030F95AED